MLYVIWRSSRMTGLCTGPHGPNVSVDALRTLSLLLRKRWPCSVHYHYGYESYTPPASGRTDPVWHSEKPCVPPSPCNTWILLLVDWIPSFWKSSACHWPVSRNTPPAHPGSGGIPYPDGRYGFVGWAHKTPSFHFHFRLWDTAATGNKPNVSYRNIRTSASSDGFRLLTIPGSSDSGWDIVLKKVLLPFYLL